MSRACDSAQGNESFNLTDRLDVLDGVVIMIKDADEGSSCTSREYAQVLCRRRLCLKVTAIRMQKAVTGERESGSNLAWIPR